MTELPSLTQLNIRPGVWTATDWQGVLDKIARRADALQTLSLSVGTNWKDAFDWEGDIPIVDWKPHLAWKMDSAGSDIKQIMSEAEKQRRAQQAEILKKKMEDAWAVLENLNLDAFRLLQPSTLIHEYIVPICTRLSRITLVTSAILEPLDWLSFPTTLTKLHIRARFVPIEGKTALCDEKAVMATLDRYRRLTDLMLDVYPTGVVNLPKWDKPPSHLKHLALTLDAPSVNLKRAAELTTFGKRVPYAVGGGIELSLRVDPGRPYAPDQRHACPDDMDRLERAWRLSVGRRNGVCRDVDPGLATIDSLDHTLAWPELKITDDRPAESRSEAWRTYHVALSRLPLWDRFDVETTSATDAEGNEAFALVDRDKKTIEYLNCVSTESMTVDVLEEEIEQVYTDDFKVAPSWPFTWMWFFNSGDVSQQPYRLPVGRRGHPAHPDYAYAFFRV